MHCERNLSTLLLQVIDPVEVFTPGTCESISNKIGFVGSASAEGQLPSNLGIADWGGADHRTN